MTLFFLSFFTLQAASSTGFNPSSLVTPWTGAAEREALVFGHLLFDLAPQKAAGEKYFPGNLSHTFTCTHTCMRTQAHAQICAHAHTHIHAHTCSFPYFHPRVKDRFLNWVLDLGSVLKQKTSIDLRPMHTALAWQRYIFHCISFSNNSTFLGVVCFSRNYIFPVPCNKKSGSEILKVVAIQLHALGPRHLFIHEQNIDRQTWI